MKYIYQLKEWPDFKWDIEKIAMFLTQVRHRQGRLLGRMEALGFHLQADATLETLTLDVLKSSEIEGEILNSSQVRSSIARHLGMDIAGLVPSDRNVDGIVEMMLDATQNFSASLTRSRLFNWHTSLFATGKSGMHKLVIGAFRNHSKDKPMQVVSGAMGKEKIHYEAPASEILANEMKAFLNWFNSENKIDPVIKAAIAHLWFITIHPFDDGNGRMARAITDMQLARADTSSQRFYSMSAQIRKDRNDYYNILEKTQKNTIDITAWLEWFLGCLDKAISATDETLAVVMNKVRFWERHVSVSLNARQRMILNKLLDGFDGKLTSSKWAKIAKCSSDTAIRDINDLINKKILDKEAKGGRSTNYVLMEI
ncbi:MAG: Fic family protein [Bacteroidota bacterium]|nr:Fic family protein [Bacteroidota bacterium]